MSFHRLHRRQILKEVPGGSDRALRGGKQATNLDQLRPNFKSLKMWVSSVLDMFVKSNHGVRWKVAKTLMKVA